MALIYEIHGRYLEASEILEPCADNDRYTLAKSRLRKIIDWQEWSDSTDEYSPLHRLNRSAIANLTDLRGKRASHQYADAHKLLLDFIASAEIGSENVFRGVMPKIYNYAGQSKLERGENAAADRFFTKSIIASGNRGATEGALVAYAIGGKGIIAFRAGHLVEAEKLLSRSVVLAEKAYGQSHIQLVPFLVELARAHMAAEDLAAAGKGVQRALQIVATANKDQRQHWHIGMQARKANAELLHLQGSRRAREELLALIEEAEAREGPQSSHLPTLQTLLAEILIDDGEFSEAEIHLHKAIAARRNTVSLGPQKIIASLYQLSRLHRERGEQNAALVVARDAVEYLRRYLENNFGSEDTDQMDSELAKSKNLLELALRLQPNL